VESDVGTETEEKAATFKTNAHRWALKHNKTLNQFMAPDPSASHLLAGERVVGALETLDVWKENMHVKFQSNAWNSAPNVHAVAHLTSVSVLGFDTAQGPALAPYVLAHILPLHQAGRPDKVVLVARTLAQLRREDITSGVNKKDSPSIFAAPESKVLTNMLTRNQGTIVPQTQTLNPKP